MIFICNCRIMSIKKSKQKDKDGSEFSRSKLEEEYSPKLRLYKKEAISMNPVSEQKKYSYKAKEES